MYLRSFVEYQLRHNLQHLILHVTNRCNLRCRHCFVDFSAPHDLDIERTRALAGEVGRLFWLDVAGGEPLLRDDLPELLDAFDVAVVQIPTNGFQPDRTVARVEAVRKRIRGALGVSLSVDGFRDAHDRLRNKPGSWDRAWETYEGLRALEGVSVKINTVLSHENADTILAFMDAVRERGPDFHSVILLRGEPNDPTVGLPPLETLERLVPDILERLATYDYGRNPVAAHLLRNYHRYLWRVSLDILRKRTQVVPCLAGQAHLVVWADGAVSSCELLPPVGNLHTQSWREILDGGALRAQRAGIRAKQCHCTHNCALLCSILFSPRHATHLFVPAKQR